MIHLTEITVQYTYTHKNTENVTKHTINRTTQKYIEHKKYIEQQTIHRTTQKLGKVRAVTRLCEFYPGICLATEEKAQRNNS
jgi:hypothetical protein